MSRHEWDILEDMVVASMVADGSIDNKPARKRACKAFNITPKQLDARANNFYNLAGARKSFWHTSRQEREAVRLLVKHNACFKI